MVRLGLLYLLGATTAVFAAPTAENYDTLDARACTVPLNSLKNPDFESKNLNSWVFKPTYQKLGTATVVSPGYKSDNAVQVWATSAINDPTSYNKLQQTFQICQASRFQLSWSMVLNKDGTAFTAPRNPGMFVEVKAPDGLLYQLASFSFGSQTYNSTVYSPSNKATHKVSEWTTYVADFPNSQTGNWTVSMEWYAMRPVPGGKTTTVKFKLDNFAVKPKPK